MVGEDKRHHRLDHRRTADTDAGVVAPLVTMSAASPARLIVGTGVRIELVGLNATRTTTAGRSKCRPAMPP